jgi:hypothetical protein
MDLMYYSEAILETLESVVDIGGLDGYLHHEDGSYEDSDVSVDHEFEQFLARVNNKLVFNYYY